MGSMQSTISRAEMKLYYFFNNSLVIYMLLFKVMFLNLRA